MAKGYQLIEPHVLDFCADPKNFGFAVAVLRWLIPLLREELPGELATVEIEIVSICRHSPYGFPGIGLHYREGANPRDLGPLVEATIDRLLNERPVIGLIKVIESNKISWIEEARKIVGSYHLPG
jgi:hypothetical protein